MKARTSDFIEQLSKEFGVSQRHIEVIINQPFKFLAQMVREKQNKTFRLHNFGIFFPKKSAKFDKNEQSNETTGDIQRLPNHDISEQGAGRVSPREVNDL